MISLRLATETISAGEAFRAHSTEHKLSCFGFEAPDQATVSVSDTFSDALTIQVLNNEDTLLVAQDRTRLDR
jgi:hypothetical protein